jgi:hypothetical protein
MVQGMKDLPDRVDEVRIVCAANRCGVTGTIILGLRHWDEFMHQQADNLPDAFNRPGLEEQGFIDNRRNFLSREEAFELAASNGQMLAAPFHPGELFSENLY